MGGLSNKRLIILSATPGCALALFILWKLHPWVHPGTYTQIRNQRIGDTELQVWQRKNKTILEPYYTFLYMRGPGQQWRMWDLDFQDVYSSDINFQVSNSDILISRGNKKLGTYNQAEETYIREPLKELLPPALLKGEPPYFYNWPEDKRH